MTAIYCIESILLSPPALSQCLQSIMSAQIMLLLLGQYVNIRAFKIAFVTYLWLFELHHSFSIHDTRDV